MKKVNRENKYIRDGRSPIPKSENTSKVMSAIRGKNTRPEMTLRKALWAEGLRGYRLHWEKAPGRPDICFPGKKIGIFVHGCYWHRCPYCKPSIPKTHKSFWEDKFEKNKERDERKKNALKKNGWKVLVFWECQIGKAVSKCVKKATNMF